MNLVKRLKEAGQDFEWYPTTPEILAAAKSIVHETVRFRHDRLSILDIGAGRGDALNALSEQGDALYAIEISSELISELPDHVTLLGTDFKLQTLIDKPVDVIFCNPPYSEYVQWVRKIIDEANCRHLLLVIPERWAEVPVLSTAIARRGFVTKRSQPFSFLDAERKARATVELVHLYLRSGAKDAFDPWFEDTFPYTGESRGLGDLQEVEEAIEVDGLVQARPLVDVLEDRYQAELSQLVAVFKAIRGLDIEVINELGASKEKLISALSGRIKGLKSKYWRWLLNHTERVTDRLTSTSRNKVLGELSKRGHVDFTSGNAYEVILWVIRQANTMLDDQLVAVFRKLSGEDCAIPYKSNTRFAKGRFRYDMEDLGPYKLDYRIISNSRCFSGWSGVSSDFGERPIELLNDVRTIAINLGFSDIEAPCRHEYAVSKAYVLKGKAPGSNKLVQFVSFRGYANGNLHLKLHPTFMLRLNVEAARILKWVSSPEEAAEEMDVPVKDVRQAIGSNKLIGLADISSRLLGNGKE